MTDAAQQGDSGKVRPRLRSGRLHLYEVILERSCEGLRPVQIASELGCPVHTVQRALRRARFMGDTRVDGGLRKRTAERDPLILEAYRSGLTFREICQRMQCSTGAVYSALSRARADQRAGVQSVPGRRSQPPFLAYDPILDLLAQGKNRKEISFELGCKPKDVAVAIEAARRAGDPRAVRRYGLNSDTRHRNESILGAWADGSAAREIADKFGCSPAAVHGTVHWARLAGDPRAARRYASRSSFQGRNNVLSEE